MLWLGKRVDGQLMVITCHYFKSLATNGKVYKPAKACRASKITVAMIYNVFIYHLANAKTINQLNFGCLLVYICEHLCIFDTPSCLEVSTCHSLCLARGKIMEKNGAWLVLARWVLWNGHDSVIAKINIEQIWIMVIWSQNGVKMVKHITHTHTHRHFVGSLVPIGPKPDVKSPTYGVEYHLIIKFHRFISCIPSFLATFSKRPNDAKGCGKLLKFPRDFPWISQGVRPRRHRSRSPTPATWTTRRTARISWGALAICWAKKICMI